MIINHNISALNTYRNLTSVNNALQKSLERLSSGLRINRAADDAAGLAISEKMRGQIRGLAQAIRNAQDAISLLQTAEGALNESHAILQRMRELANQAASDTNTPDDRLKIQQEIDALAKELSRITNTTEFNTKNLLAGGLQSQKFQIGANADQNVELTISAMDAYTLGVTAAKGAYLIQGNNVVVSAGPDIGALATGVYSVDFDYYAEVGPNPGDLSVRTDLQGWQVELVNNVSGDTSTTATIDEANKKITVELKDDGAGGITATWDEVVNAIKNASGNDGRFVASTTNGGATASTTASPVPLDDIYGALLDEDGNVKATATADTSGSSPYTLSFDSDGDTSTDLSVDVNTTDLASVGTVRIQVVSQDSRAATVTSDGQVVQAAYVEKGLLVLTQEMANNALTLIDNAIAKVSDQRAQLGALQNRLEHTINNLSVAKENLTAAESRIRDLDMAEEMMAFTRNQIISQAATAMLAQANQVPAIVLQLLR